jgi:hypothetical protein
VRSPPKPRNDSSPRGEPCSRTKSAGPGLEHGSSVRSPSNESFPIEQRNFAKLRDTARVLTEPARLDLELLKAEHLGDKLHCSKRTDSQSSRLLSKRIGCDFQPTRRVYASGG